MCFSYLGYTYVKEYEVGFLTVGFLADYEFKGRLDEDRGVRIWGWISSWIWVKRDWMKIEVLKNMRLDFSLTMSLREDWMKTEVRSIKDRR